MIFVLTSVYSWGILHKGYKCLSPSGKLIVSKDVIFNENRFPIPDLFPSSNSKPKPLPHTITLSPLPIPTAATTPETSQTTTAATIPETTQIPDPILSPNSSQDTSVSPSTQAPTIVTTAPAGNQTAATSTNPSTNTHHMQTRSKTGIHLPRLHPSVFLTTIEPKTTKQALKDPNCLLYLLLFPFHPLKYVIPLSFN